MEEPMRSIIGRRFGVSPGLRRGAGSDPKPASELRCQTRRVSHLTRRRAR
jgi:hypothetical protein